MLLHSPKLLAFVRSKIHKKMTKTKTFDVFMTTNRSRLKTAVELSRLVKYFGSSESLISSDFFKAKSVFEWLIMIY